MECYVHVGEPAVGACVACGRFVCDVCRVDVEGAIWCKGCLAQGNRPPSTPSGSFGSRPLRRSNREKLLGGVCGGIAKTFDHDVSAVRLVVALLTFLTGFFPGLIAYIIFWAVVPAED
ncbi:MAG: PspC domain-containing protein [Planctomycetota bacterium]